MDWVISTEQFGSFWIRKWIWNLVFFYESVLADWFQAFCDLLDLDLDCASPNRLGTIFGAFRMGSALFAHDIHLSPPIPTAASVGVPQGLLAKLTKPRVYELLGPLSSVADLGQCNRAELEMMSRSRIEEINYPPQIKVGSTESVPRL